MINGGNGTDTLNIALTAANTVTPTTVVGVEDINVNVTAFTVQAFDALGIVGNGSTITVNNLQVAGTTDATVNNVTAGATVVAGSGVTGTLTVDADGYVNINGASATEVIADLNAVATGSTIIANSATGTAVTTGSAGIEVANAAAVTISSTSAKFIIVEGTAGLTDSATISAKNASTTTVVGLETVLAGQQVEYLTLSGNGGAVTFDLDATGDDPTKYTFTGDQNVTLVGTAAQFTADTGTDSTTAGTTTLKIDTTSAATHDLDAIAVDVIDIAATGAFIATYTVANNQAVKMSAIAGDDVTINCVATGSQTLNLTLAASQNTAGAPLKIDGFSTVNLIVDDGASTTGTITVTDLDGNDTAGKSIVVTGSDNLTLTGANSAFLNAAAFAGKLNVTTAADMLKITGGTGSDTFNATDVDFTIDGTSGTADTLAFAATTDLSNNSATFTNIDIIQLDSATDAAETVTMKSALVDGKTMIVKGTATVDTLAVVMQDAALDLSGLTVDTATAKITITDTAVDALDIDYSVIGSSGADTLTSTATNAITIDGRAGDDVITTGTGADSITGGAGADNIDGSAGNDTISAGEGVDEIIGAAGADTIDLTETTSAIDYVVVEAITDGSAAGAAAGTFSGYDTITGFVAAKDFIVFDSAYSYDAAVTTAILDVTFVAASDAATTASV